MQQEVTQTRRMCGWVGVTMGALLLAAAAVAAGGPGYHIIATHKLGGDGGDFVAVDADVGDASVGGGYDGAVANYGVKTHLRSSEEPILCGRDFD